MSSVPARTGLVTVVAALLLLTQGTSPTAPESGAPDGAAFHAGPAMDDRSPVAPPLPTTAAPALEGAPLTPTDSIERLAVLRGRAGATDPDAGLDDVGQVGRTTTDEGYELATGGSEAGNGTTVRFTVEVEPATDLDLSDVVAAVEDALFNPRGWGRDVRLVRTDDVDAADVRVLLGTPDTIDRLCGAAGMDTGGRFSCWTGRFAALNAWRFDHGAPDFDDLVTYRRYLVNHEVGHALGHGHVDCPEPEAPAPVMMQQSVSTGACTANGWPYPDAD